MISFVVLKVDDVRFLIEDYLKNEVHIIFKKWRGKFIIHYDNTKQQPTIADCCKYFRITNDDIQAFRITNPKGQI